MMSRISSLSGEPEAWLSLSKTSSETVLEDLLLVSAFTSLFLVAVLLTVERLEVLVCETGSDSLISSGSSGY